MAGVARSDIAELPERQRIAIFLRHFADLDYRGISEALERLHGTQAIARWLTGRGYRTKQGKPFNRKPC
jgi:DNA-directed RNA polymerase specialized sigma24 family protein